MNKIFLSSRQSGFTLLEILLVVAAIAILAGIVIFAINPAKQLGDTRNAQRKVDVNTILNAMHQYFLDHNGQFPGSDLSSSEIEICQTGASSCASLLDLDDLTENSKYLVAIPIDPSINPEETLSTGYQISQSDSNGALTVSAPNAENDITISITR